MVSGEVHYNGIGARDASGYPEVLRDPRVVRGETYFLGRWYARAAAMWSGADRITLAASLLGNLSDRSISLSPSATYYVGRHGRVSAGALLTAGERPHALPGSPTALPTEFGAYGDLLFAQAGVYF